MSGTRRLLHPRSWIAAASLGAVLVVAYVDVGRRSPGPVSGVHARVAELEGGAACAACHGGWSQSLSDACLVCHELIGLQIEAAEGLHGTLAEASAAITDARACGRCHGEHHGLSFTTVNTRSFALAGVADVLAFDHSRIGWQMDGRHTELTCVECHQHAGAGTLPEGARRFLDESQSCATCHDDPHAGQFALACSTCHVQTSFDQHVFPDHTRHLALVGGHADLSCRDCHDATNSHSLEVLAAERSRPSARGCSDCHESPHTAAMVEGLARQEGLPVARACSVCHTQEAAAFTVANLEFSVELHALTAFPLAGAHAEVACSQCHGDATRGADVHYLGTPMRCEDCHGDAHRGAFAAHVADLGAEAAGTCAVCHGAERFAEVVSFEHGHFTGFTLEGAHRESECAACHVTRSEPDEFGRSFGRADERFPLQAGNLDAPSEPGTCARCHKDPHDGMFAAPPGAPAATDCARCHGEVSFRAVVDSFDHGAETGFVLAGAHRLASCGACHAPLAAPDRLGRTMEAAHGTRCADCHADPHGGQFQRPDVLLPEGETDCGRCHDPGTAFRASRFDHSWDTRFSLEGPHADLACAACHRVERTETDPRVGLVRYRPLGTQCVDCHGDQAGALRRRAPGRRR